MTASRLASCPLARILLVTLLSLVPAAGVRQVYDTFDSTAGEHFIVASQ